MKPRAPHPKSHHGGGGTWLEPEELCYPSGAMLRRCGALHPDGKLRIVRCGIPDTYFSIPASGGYITIENGTYWFHTRTL